MGYPVRNKTASDSCNAVADKECTLPEGLLFSLVEHADEYGEGRDDCSFADAEEEAHSHETSSICTGGMEHEYYRPSHAISYQA